MLNPDNVDDALDVCAAVDDGEFQYSCATGIFMNMHISKESFSPCDTSRFPATCFRFAGSFFEKYEKYQGVCDTQCDPYHKMGCIYGQKYNLKEKDLKKACIEFLPEVPNQEPESLYHAACVEGYFSVEMYNPKADKYCDQIKEHQASYEVCERKKDFNRKDFTGSEEAYFNAALLETLYDPITSNNCEPVKRIGLKKNN